MLQAARSVVEKPPVMFVTVMRFAVTPPAITPVWSASNPTTRPPENVAQPPV
jgi:hypothetical protein